MLETSHPPTIYVPREDVQEKYLKAARGRTYCEFKGTASYYHLKVGKQRAREAAWYYSWPSEGYEPLEGHIAFFPGRVDECYLDGERVEAQPGDIYGGWITSDLKGPFKGPPGTLDW